MFMTAAEIEACTSWLLDNASAPVKYLTHKYLLKADPHSAQMQALWQAVEHSPEAREIFSRQNADGSWFSGGPWGPSGYRRQTGYTPDRPKFVTTAWILPFLGEMGFTVQDERVRKGCEYILREIHYPPSGAATLAENCCGLYAIPLRACASVGLTRDERIQGGWGQLVHCQRSDGGWLNPNHLPDARTPSTTQGRWPWERSCAWGSTFAAQALFYSENPQHKPALRAALEFILWHLSQKDEAHIQNWVYHGHNTVKELLMFSAAGMDMNAKPIPALLDWLKGYYSPQEGHFRAVEQPVTNFPRQISAIMKAYSNRYGEAYWGTIPKVSAPILRYQIFHLVEDDWLTYTAARIGENLRFNF
jgi:hypothetical protein